jgi:hypothetical protein
MAALRGRRARQDHPWGRDLVLCGVSSHDDDDDDGHDLIRGHDACWTQVLFESLLSVKMAKYSGKK